MAEKKICPWYPVCPMKRLLAEGRIEKSWIRRYCFNEGRNCQRLQALKEGRTVSDNMLPDGTIKKN
jgi:hypothetical protein